MDQSHTPTSATPAVRHDGWTPQRKALFLDHLANHGDVRAACRACGLSREAAYRLRRRDGVFARAWAAALVLARHASGELLACRAINGVEEEVWHGGQMVGTRIRFDTRLLLAHMARLDALAECDDAREDAARFDELIALAAGAEPPEGLIADDDGVPLPRQACVDYAVEVADELAREEAAAAAAQAAGDDSGEYWDEHDEATCEAIEALVDEARWESAAEIAALCDGWVEQAREAVDALLAGDAPPAPRTLSTVSTSPLAEGAVAGQP